MRWKSIVVVGMLILGYNQITFGQPLARDYYTLKMYNKTFEVEGNTYKGASTALWHPYKEVKKQWWKYIKSKAYLTNHVSHYILKIPNESKEESPVYLVNTIHENEGQTIIRIAYQNQEVADNKDLKNFLLEFKLTYFTQLLETQIKDQEKTSSKLGSQLDKYIAKSLKKEQDSLKTKNQIDLFEYQIHQSDLKLDSLKNILMIIK